jgi:beta-galactosidase
VANPFSKFLYGVCYYPEAWDPARHESDINRIADAGFNFVRMGEGAWSYWEPAEGQFQFALFDRAIDLCDKRNIRVILGTPTYTCPAWVAVNYPEVLRWNFDRIPMKHGSRRNLNYTAPKMLELSDRLCCALASHYRDHPQVIGWQLDNEFNCHMDVSYAPSDTLAFRAWLRERYETLERLNHAWGTSFWSQTYSDWNQIDLPHPTATYHNPTQLIDESRFISDTVVRFAARQAAILRKANPDWFITHNGLFANIEGPRLVGQLDFFSHDQYPLFSKHWTEYAEPLIQARSLSLPFGILEQQSGPGGQMQYFHRTPRSGEMRLWAWQSILHGAGLLSFFRWRTCPFGSEQHWHGLLDPDDRDTRRLAEAIQLGKELRDLPADFFASRPVRSVAVVRDFDNEINEKRINTYTADGRGEHTRWTTALLRQHIPIDQTWPKADWTDYRLLILPHLKMTDAALIARLTEFVSAGGAILMCAQSGVKDRNLHLVPEAPPGPLAALAGVEVEDWSTLPTDQSRPARLVDGQAFELTTFVERLRPTTANALAHWETEDSLLAGAAALTVNAVGQGQVFYCGGYVPAASVESLCGFLLPRLDLRPPIQISHEVEVILRQSATARYLCLLNHTNLPQSITLPPRCTDLLPAPPTADLLPPLTVRIIRF